MAWELKGKCDKCSAVFGPLVDRGATIYLCRDCGEYHSIDQVPRRFELPLCGRCGTRYLESDLVKERSPSLCPSCGAHDVKWTSTSHLLIYYDEADPQIGEIAQGHIRNTGYIQRIKFMNSVLLGRIGSDEPVFEDGTPVEAEIIGIGRRSLDVRNVRELPDAPRLKRVEPQR